MKARIIRVIRTQEGLYDALIDLGGEDGWLIAVPGLIREPDEVIVEEVPDGIEIRLRRGGEGIASCHISRKALEEGFTTMTCPKGKAWVLRKDQLRAHLVKGSQ